jgi:hypothetical protein
LSQRLIDRSLERLVSEADGGTRDATLYDLWNALSYLGTHDQAISLTYRSRLRIGAGEFSRHRSRICSACQQLMLSDDQNGAGQHARSGWMPLSPNDVAAEQSAVTSQRQDPTDVRGD